MTVSSKQNINDLTSGSLTKAILRLAIPAIGMNYMQALYNIIDTIWVGRLGAQALAGISTGGFILWGIFSLINIVSVGIGAVIARRIGEGDTRSAQEVAVQGLIFSVITSAVLGVFLLALREPLFAMMKTSPEVTRLGISYLTVLIYGILSIFASFVITAILQAAGDTYTPMRLMFWSLLLNAVLDPLLIFGWYGFPEMGIIGAAWATIISRIFFVLWGLKFLIGGKGKIRLIRPDRFAVDWGLFGKVVRIGIPASVAGILFSLVYMFLTRYVSGFGDHCIAAMRIGHMVESINFFTGLGFASAAATLVGQNLGANQPARAEKAIYRILFMLSCLTGLATIFFFITPELIVRIFTQDPLVISVGASYLVILAYSQLFMGVEITVAGAFSGAGDTLPPMLVSIPLTILRVPLAYLLIQFTGMGVDGVWWAISSTTIFKGVLITLWFKTGRWTRIKV